MGGRGRATRGSDHGPKQRTKEGHGEVGTEGRSEGTEGRMARRSLPQLASHPIAPPRIPLRRPTPARVRSSRSGATPPDTYDLRLSHVSWTADTRTYGLVLRRGGCPRPAAPCKRTADCTTHASANFANHADSLEVPVRIQRMVRIIRRLLSATAAAPKHPGFRANVPTRIPYPADHGRANAPNN